jgi:hypothetical protein
MVSVMNKVLDTIKEFHIIKINNEMIIKCNKYNLILPIKDGTVIINIIDENKEKIGINELNINDRITILYRDISDELEKKYIKPIKIIKHFNYILNSDSSDSD